jgi:cytosine/adenosine deaminase-related metal-dependent hydrolase
VVDANSVRTVGSLPDQVILSATATDVRKVVVDGETVVEDGEHPLGPVAPQLAKALDRLDVRA